MKTGDPVSGAAAIETDELFEMANLYPRTVQALKPLPTPP